ncbi:MAG: RNA polymerase sigma factor [Roseiflexus sp.]|nr:MAG: RNA polymerase sigma factor [Roseiflexus sp.]
MGCMDDTELVDRLKRFDPQAVSWIVERYGAALHRYVTAIVADPHLAEDIVAETYARMLERIGDYKVTGAPFRAWLYRIAHNLAINAVTRNRSASDDLTLARAEASSGNPAEIFEREELHQALQRASQTLTEEQQQVLLLRFVAGLSIAEAAQQLQRSEGSVKQLQLRGLRALGRMLGAAEAEVGNGR